MVLRYDLITDKHRAKAKASKNEKALTGSYDCPMLEDGKCSIYEVRPIVCSTYFEVGESSKVCVDPYAKVPYISGNAIVDSLGDKVLNKDTLTMKREVDLLDLFD